MLQQTQVDRVVPKYHEFLALFPTLKALAEAPVADVIRAWATLGYNRRAVRLHALAVRVVAERQGVLPARVEDLVQLDGLGAYTAAAVACFAFDQQVPVVDTNVRRVLARFGADRLGNEAASPRDLQNLSREALAEGQASAWNQALMDLGATICTSRAPACQRCPIEDVCAARATGRQYSRGRFARAAEERVSYRPSQSFQGSSRYYRGRTVSLLRSLSIGEALSLAELGPQVRPEFASTDLPWLARLVRALAADGLVKLSPDPAVSDLDLRVSLP